MTETVYQVCWTLTARQDLKRIIDYISADSETEAVKIYTAVRKKSADLQLMPQRGRIVPELRDYGVLSYREIIISPWRIVYKVLDSSVIVLAVIDGRRSLEDLLLDRLI